MRAAAGGIGASAAGRTIVTQLEAVMALSDFVISLDTGTMHIARAVGTPMVALAPSWEKPIEWVPHEQPQLRILRGADREVVPADYQLDEIEAEDVMRAFDDLSARRWSSRADRLRLAVEDRPPCALIRLGRVRGGW